MTKFEYKVKRGAENVTTGVLEADSQRAAIAQLRDQGFFPISVKEFQEGRGVKKPRRTTFKRIRLKDRNLFFRQLANLTESGMPILRALATLKNQTETLRMQEVIEDLHDAVQRGSSLADALARHPKAFPPMYTSLTRAGEAGGMLDESLWRMVAFGEQDEELRGKAVSAMVYPAFLLVMGSIAIFILVSFVFPNFVEVFDDFDASLPAATRAVIAVSGFMGAYWWAVLIGLGFALAGFNSYRNGESGRRQLDLLWLKTPLVGSLVQRYETAKFARTLGTLFDNGVPVLSALRITADTLGNSVMREEIGAVHSSVADGDSISHALAKVQHFPPLVINMMAVGEESGKLGEVTKRVADAYDVEVERAVKALTSLLEPLLIVVMGVIIGALVISMLLPMLTLSSQVR